MPLAAIKLRGFRELQAANKAAGREVKRQTDKALREAVEPIRADAEALARARISRIGESWSQMRIGVTSRVVYLAPKQRSRASRANPRLRRPNLATLLMGRSMEPALERNLSQTEARVGHALDIVGDVWEGR